MDLDRDSIHVPSLEKKPLQLPEIPRKRLLSRLKNCIGPSVYIANRHEPSLSSKHSQPRLDSSAGKSLLSKVSMDLSSAFDSTKNESGSSLAEIFSADFCFQGNTGEFLHAGPTLRESDLLQEGGKIVGRIFEVAHNGNNSNSSRTNSVNGDLLQENQSKNHDLSSIPSNSSRSEKDSTFSLTGVREAFLSFFVMLLSNYQNCYTKTGDLNGSTSMHLPHDFNGILAGDGLLWNKKKFLHNQSRSRHMGRDVRAFLSRVTDTQLFEDFVRTHAPPSSSLHSGLDDKGASQKSNSGKVPSEVCLFDEYVTIYQAKNSRSFRRKVEKARESGHSLTPLLDVKNSSGIHHTETYVVPPPTRKGLTLWRHQHDLKKRYLLCNESGSTKDFNILDTFPHQFDPVLFGDMRPHQYLVDNLGVASPMQHLLQAVRNRHTLTTHLERKKLIASARNFTLVGDDNSNKYVHEVSASNIENKTDMSSSVRSSSMMQMMEHRENLLSMNSRVSLMSPRAFAMRNILVFIDEILESVLVGVMLEAARIQQDKYLKKIKGLEEALKLSQQKEIEAEKRLHLINDAKEKQSDNMKLSIKSYNSRQYVIAENSGIDDGKISDFEPGKITTSHLGFDTPTTAESGDVETCESAGPEASVDMESSAERFNPKTLAFLAVAKLGTLSRSTEIAMPPQRCDMWMSCINFTTPEKDTSSESLAKLLKNNDNASYYIELLESVDRSHTWYSRLETEVGSDAFSSILDKLARPEIHTLTEDTVEELEKKQSLRRRILFGVLDLIAAFVAYDPEVGYCRGMCNVAALLLLHFDNPNLEVRLCQHRAFNVFAALIHHLGMNAGFAPGVHAVRSLKNVYDRAQIFSLVLQKGLPSLAEHFVSINLEVSTTVAPWLRTALADFHVLSPDLVARSWDVMFVQLRLSEEEAWHVVYKVLLVIFQKLSSTLLELGLEDSLRVLWDVENQRPDVYDMKLTELFNWDDSWDQLIANSY